MNEYEKIFRQIRSKVSKLTLEQQKELNKLYDSSIRSLANKAKKSNSKSLTNRWVLDYRKQLMESRKALRVEIRKQITSSITEATRLGIEGQQIIFRKIFDLAGLEVSESFSNMFSKVNDNVIKDIISGNLYKDNKTLSNRIWNYGEDYQKDIQYVVNQAILEKKSAIELAEDLERYVLDPAKRGSDWGSCYPHLRSKKVDYNAIRLARTSINHAYQNATIQSSGMNPFVEGIEWQSALIHGRTCELCRERHGRVYLVEDVPLDHP